MLLRLWPPPPYRALTFAFMLVKERVEIDRRLTKDGVGFELVVVEDTEVKLAIGRHQPVTEITTCQRAATRGKRFAYTMVSA